MTATQLALNRPTFVRSAPPAVYPQDKYERFEAPDSGALRDACHQLPRPSDHGLTQLNAGDELCAGLAQ